MIAPDILDGRCVAIEIGDTDAIPKSTVERLKKSDIEAQLSSAVTKILREIADPVLQAPITTRLADLVYSEQGSFNQMRERSALADSNKVEELVSRGITVDPQLIVLHDYLHVYKQWSGGVRHKLLSHIFGDETRDPLDTRISEALKTISSRNALYINFGTFIQSQLNVPLLQYRSNKILEQNLQRFKNAQLVLPTLDIETSVTAPVVIVLVI